MSPPASGRSAPLGLDQQRSPAVPQDEVVLLVPVGSVEQHGPHLPLATDTVVARAVTEAAAERLSAEGRCVLVAPTVSYGASGEHEGFPGTVSIGQEALALLITELVRSADRWARGVVLVNGHGGNVATLVRAVRGLRAEGRSVAWTATALAGSDAHAGDTETSLLRHLAPWSVRVDLMAPGVTEPVSSLMPRLRSGGVAAVSRDGVLGDPTTSSADRGRVLFDRLVDNLVAEVRRLEVAEDGRLLGGLHPAAPSDPT